MPPTTTSSSSSSSSTTTNHPQPDKSSSDPSSSSTTPPQPNSHRPYPNFHPPLDSNPIKPPSSHPVSSLLPPLDPYASRLANETGLPPEQYGHAFQPSDRVIQHQQTQYQSSPAIPEKCLTFCSQRQDAQSFCRMFCLRKNPPLPTQAEALARLRPPPNRNRENQFDSNSSIPNTATSKSSSLSSWKWNPFESLRRSVSPYSFIYVTGTPDGVVGRYMEELEADDGSLDFGALSRAANDRTRRRREADGDGWEYLDWGENGSLFYLPITSLLYPITSIPNTLSRLFTPSINFLTNYNNSFWDGTQKRGYERFVKQVNEGGAGMILDKFAENVKKKRDERLAELREREVQRKQHHEQIRAQSRKLWDDVSNETLRRSSGSKGSSTDGSSSDGAGVRKDEEK